MELYVRAFVSIIRYLLPVLSILMLSLCTYGLLKKKIKPYKILLVTENGKEKTVTSGEYIIGSDQKCDIVLEGTKQRHAVLSISNNFLSLKPVEKSKISIDKKIIKDETRFSPDSKISMGDREITFTLKSNRGVRLGNYSILKTVAFACLNIIEIFVYLSLIFAFTDKVGVISAVFGVFIIGQWAYMFVTRFLGAFLEIPVLFLVTLGISVAAHNSAFSLIKQFVCFIVGFAGAVILAKILERPKIAIGFKGVALIVGVVFFAANMVYGVIYNGSQNWIDIGGLSFQPSELIKVILIFVSGAALDRLSNKKDVISFVIFAVFCLFTLAYLSDFGTALIYAFVLLTVLFLRLGSFKVLAASLGGAVLCGGIVMLIFPYVAKRVFSFGSAFENASGSGFQQTRAMISAASGGFFGVGGGRGTLTKITAFDTDIVFGLITEEWGLLISLCVLFCFVLFALYAVKTLTVSSSKYYAITCCSASVLMLVQTSLNVFGTLDMLPFTGVTLPFISVGGSSLISSVMLIAFFRAAVSDEHKIITERRRKDD